MSKDSNSEKPTVTSDGHAVLVVDDEISILQILSIGLRNHGYHARTAQTVATAVQIAEEEEFDFALVDIRLPDGNGIEVCEKLRALHPRIVIVIITGYPDLSTTIEAIRLHAYDYIIKPFRIEQVLQVLARGQNQLTLEDSNTDSQDRIRELEEDNERLRSLLYKYLPPDKLASARQEIENPGIQKTHTASALRSYKSQQNSLNGLIQSSKKSR